MILRRVIAHFKKQEWTAIALDFLIVVFGVFIGIQVANWNESRADDRRGEEFVTRLTVALERDLETRTALTAYYDAVNDSALRAIASLDAPPADAQSLVVNVYRATELAYDPQTRATWDEIVAAGDVGLLPRAAVEQGLNIYYGVDVAEQTRQEIANSRLRAHVRSIIPHRVQAAIRAGCSDVTAPDGRVLGFTPDCTLDIARSEIDATAALLRADPDLLPALTLHVSALNSARNNLRGDIYSIAHSIELLQAGDAQVQSADEMLRTEKDTE